MKTIRTIGLAIAMASLAACTNMTKEQQGTVTGGLMGAAAGAGIAAIAGGSAWTGAAIRIQGLVATTSPKPTVDSVVRET